MQQKKLLEEQIDTIPNLSIYAFAILIWNREKKLREDCVLFNLGIDLKSISQILLLNKIELETRENGFLITYFQEEVVLINLSSYGFNENLIFIYLTGKNANNTYSEIYNHAQVLNKQFEDLPTDFILSHLISSFIIPKLTDLKGIIMLHHSGELLYKQLDKDLITNNSSILTINNYHFSYKSVVTSLYHNPEFNDLKRINVGDIEICVKLIEEFGFIFIIEKMSQLLKRYLTYILEKFHLKFYGALFSNPHNRENLREFHNLLNKIFSIS